MMIFSLITGIATGAISALLPHASMPYLVGVIFALGYSVYLRTSGTKISLIKNVLWLIGSALAFYTAYHTTIFVLAHLLLKQPFRNLTSLIIGGAVGTLILCLSYNISFKKRLDLKHILSLIIIGGALGATGLISITALFIIWQSVMGGLLGHIHKN